MRMKILLLGGVGLMGPAVARDLLKGSVVDHVVVGDIAKDKLEQLEKKVKNNKLSTDVVDVRDQDWLISYIKKEQFDCVINSLPHAFSVSSIEAGIKAGVNVVDLAFEPPQLEMDTAAKKAGVTVVPACGMDPGITNVLTGIGVSMLDKAEEIHIIAGGIPDKPYPPLNHKILFRLESLWMEYIEPSLAIRNGKKVHLETLSEVETAEFPGVGTLEAAITPTLASMPYTLKGVKEMDCKCPRWPGHYDKIKAFIKCGLLDADPVKIGETKIVPRDFLSALLSPIMELGEGKDITVIRVMVSGKKEGKDTFIQFDITDWYDKKENITSVARTTGYPASIVAQMIGRGEITEKGVLFPEQAITPELFGIFNAELAKRNIMIQETITTTHEL
jgi:lysine 6-dehydrogenase